MEPFQAVQNENQTENQPGYLVTKLPMLLIQKCAFFVVLLPMVICWFFFAFQFFANNKNNKDSDVLIFFLVGIPSAIVIYYLFARYTSRIALRKLDSMSLELGLNAFCHYGAPAWIVHFPHFRGQRNGHQIFIHFTSGKRFRRVSLDIQGPQVNLIPDYSLSEIISAQKLKLIGFTRSTNQLSMTIPEHLFDLRTENWLIQTIDLLGKK